MVLEGRTTAQRLGLGAKILAGRRGGGRGERRQGQVVYVRAGNQFPRATSRHIQIPLQRDLLRARRKREVVKGVGRGEWGGGRRGKRAVFIPYFLIPTPY